MAATADRNTKIRAGGHSRTIICKVAATTTIYNGTMVAKNAAGYVVPASNAAAQFVIGKADKQVVNAGAAGAAEIPVITCVAKFANSAGAPVVQANMHGPVFVEDDQTVTATATNSCKAGICDGIDADGVWIMMSPEVGRIA